MGKITTVGIDLAKNVFSVHAIDESGAVVFRKAICEAMQRPAMRFVPVKSAEQQAVLSVHRVRQGFVEERTAAINRIRGLLAEFGQVLPQRAAEVRRGAAAAAEGLPALAREAIGDLLGHLRALDERIAGYDSQLGQLARSSEAARRLMSLPGVGPLTALATVASVGHAHEFTNGRQFAAWLGLVPRQWSTGGKARLGRITKRGDAYLRTFLVSKAMRMGNTGKETYRSKNLSNWGSPYRSS